MKSPSLAIVAVAILWAGVIFAVSSTLYGTPYLTPVLVYIGSGVAVTLIIVGTSLHRIRSAGH